jgi:hypothetical protein
MRPRIALFFLLSHSTASHCEVLARHATLEQMEIPCESSTPPENCGVGLHHPGTRMGMLYARLGAAYAVATVLFLPLSGHSASVPASKVMPAVAAWLTFTRFRERHLFPFLCAHEIMNDVCSDIVAQAYSLRRKPQCSKMHKRLVIDGRRVIRSASSAMIADDFPFLIWSRLLHSAFVWGVDTIRSSDQLLASALGLLTQPFMQALAKMVVTQVVYEPVSSAGYLAVQALLKGRGWRGAVSEVRQKLYVAWRDGLIYWSLAHVGIFMIPYWWLQPLADNVATMFFNAYLSVLSNDETSDDK